MPSTLFHEFYQEFWGERWPALWASLAQPEVRVARRNQFSAGQMPLNLWRPESPMPIKQWGLIDAHSEGVEAVRGPEGLLSYYIMDPASIFVAQALECQPDDVVLDMCAAPGGKSLILIEALASGAGKIILNELSMPRRERLKKVVQQFVDREVRNRVHLGGKDGGRFALTHPGQFDRILLDAPCSGERHLLQNSKELEQWSPQRSKGLVKRQYGLLTGALEALKPGGSLVYSTCSISKIENEGVIEKFLAKKAGRVEQVGFNGLPAEAEVLPSGAVYFLPDRCGYGPIFMAKFLKTSEDPD